MHGARLTIAIPTFDRASYLAETLRAFANEAAGLEDAVAFLVIDNHSSDQTREVVADFARRYPRVEYQRNAENIGLERNIMACALKSKGTFTWIFGDDDLPVPGALVEALKLIETRPSSDLFLLNYSQRDRTMSSVLAASVLHQGEDIEFESVNEFFGVLGSAEIMNFISAFAFRTECMQRTAFESFAGFGSYFGHVGALIEGFHGRKCYYVGKPMVIQRQGNQRIDDEAGKDANTFKYDLRAFLGFLRLLDLLLEQKSIVPDDIDTITAKRYFGPISESACVGILDWWTDRVLKETLLSDFGLSGSDAFAEIRRLVSTRDFGKSGQRVRNIVNLTTSIGIAFDTLRHL